MIYKNIYDTIIPIRKITVSDKDYYNATATLHGTIDEDILNSIIDIIPIKTIDQYEIDTFELIIIDETSTETISAQLLETDIKNIYKTKTELNLLDKDIIQKGGYNKKIRIKIKY